MDNDDKPFEKHKIVCIGDSITLGKMASSPNMSYPAILGQLLDPEQYEVVNLGVEGATLQKETDKSMWNEESFQKLMESGAQTILLMLGTMDAKGANWDEDRFQADFYEFIMMIQGMESCPRLFIMIPPPLYQEGLFDINQEVLQYLYPSQIPDIALTMGIENDMIINVFDALGGEGMAFPHYFADGLHPNDQGYLRIAEYALECMHMPSNIPQNKREWVEYLGHTECAFFLQAIGNQDGKILSHAGANLQLVDTVGGEGELFKVIIKDFPFKEHERVTKLYFQCLGEESHLYLSHAHAQICLKPASYEGEEFHLDVNAGGMFDNKAQQDVTFNLSGGESHMIMGHFDGQILCLPKDAADMETSRWRIVRA